MSTFPEKLLQIEKTLSSGRSSLSFVAETLATLITMRTDLIFVEGQIDEQKQSLDVQLKSLADKQERLRVIKDTEQKNKTELEKQCQEVEELMNEHGDLEMLKDAISTCRAKIDSTDKKIKKEEDTLNRIEALCCEVNTELEERASNNKKNKDQLDKTIEHVKLIEKKINETIKRKQSLATQIDTHEEELTDIQEIMQPLATPIDAQ